VSYLLKEIELFHNHSLELLIKSVEKSTH